MRKELAATIALGLALGTAAAQYPNPYGQGGYGGYGQGGYGQGGYGQGGYNQGGYAPPYNPYTGTGAAPNIYNRGTQPLSPYLNLLRNGNNPAVDYYFGVRPGTPAGQPLGGMGGGYNPGMMNGMGRPGYLPYASIPTADTLPLPDAGAPVVLGSPGHPVGYGNAYGISRVGVGGAGGRGGFFPTQNSGTIRPQQSQQGGTAPRR